LNRLAASGAEGTIKHPQVLIRTTGRPLQRGKVFQQHPVNKNVAAAYLASEEPLDCVVEEWHIVKRS
jgi:hypothetical protein